MSTFQISSGFVHLTDPCYEADGVCNLSNVPAKNGTWYYSHEYNDGIVTSFECWHEDHESDCMQSINMDFGVDSGQFGLFDISIYSHGDSASDFEDTNTFYGKCCEASKSCIGTVDNAGVVSSSGYGDGGYEGSAAYEDGNLVRFRIDFISDRELSYILKEWSDIEEDDEWTIYSDDEEDEEEDEN